MPNKLTHVIAVPLPAHSQLTHAYESVNLADAYAVQLPPGASADPEVLARYIFSRQPAWIGGLMKVRDAAVAGFGLKTAKHLGSLGGGANPDRVNIFKIYSRSAAEIVLGEDDKHLDFRVSVLLQACAEPTPDGPRQLVVSTVVKCHNRLGRAYIVLIAPFHRLVVQSSLRRAAQMGWPVACGA